MAALRVVFRALHPTLAFTRSISTSTWRFAGAGNAKEPEGVHNYRKIQTRRTLNPHVTNTNSTNIGNTPSVGVHNSPPELISSIDPKYTPKGLVPDNSEIPRGGYQKDLGDDAGTQATTAELEVGEMEGGKFKIEPLRRMGENVNTMRARLQYQSRKRGTLESDLLLSTFADAYLKQMTSEQMAQYDLFLDENDWDIYYWATQEPVSGPQETTIEANVEHYSAIKQNELRIETNGRRRDRSQSGEWAQTVGTFRPAYRPVPARWKDSEILAMLRRHVQERSAGGTGGEKTNIRDSKGNGLAFMPEVRNMDK